MTGPVIFYYHRVVRAAQHDPLGIFDHWPMQVELQHFRQQVEIIARRFRVVILDDLLDQSRLKRSRGAGSDLVR